jgi:hypothetical protein
MGKQVRLPSIRARFVKRARHLQRHRPFLRALEDALARWNERYPELAIHDRGVPPDHPPEWWDFEPMPAFLFSAYVAYQERLQADEAAVPPLGLPKWRRLLRELCRAWWPSEYYPNWTDGDLYPIDHPAMPFVAACLLWQPALLVPEEWISSKPLSPDALGFDPSGRTPLEMLQLQELMIRASEAADDLADACAAKPQPPEEVLKELFDRAETTIRALGTVLHSWKPKDSASPTQGEGFYYVRIFPGMTSSDWRALESSALECAATALRDRARRLAEDGHSIRSIASLLGVSRLTVKRMLAPP